MRYHLICQNGYIKETGISIGEDVEKREACALLVGM